MATPYIKHTQDVLRSVCKGEEATAEVVEKRYAEVTVAMLQVASGQEGTSAMGEVSAQGLLYLIFLAAF
jgi:hypothetical protein